MFFLTPKFIKQGRLYVKAAEKKLAGAAKTSFTKKCVKEATAAK